MLSIGIDPGLSGAVACIGNGAVQLLFDIPVTAKLYGKGNIIDASALLWKLKTQIDSWNYTEHGGGVIHSEALSAMPGQGVTGMFSLGHTMGVIEGVRASLGLTTHYWRPQQWKKWAGIAGKDKDRARTLAAQLYPAIAEKLTRKKDDGRAEAILIAHYGPLLAKGAR